MTVGIFADLVPAASATSTTAAPVTTTAHTVPMDQRGVHPVAADYSSPEAFSEALHNWMFVPHADPAAVTGYNVPPPAPAATGTESAPAPVPVGTAPGTTPGTTTGTAAPTPSALSGWDTFYNSPTYQVPLAAGLKGVNVHYAALGALESGAAMKAISDYAAGSASSALSTYMDDLYRQEALGAGAASNLAGAGQNLVSQVSSNNNNAANATGNAQLVAGQGSANNWNNAGAAIGTAAGAIAGAFPSSYAPTNALASSYYTPTVNGIAVPV